MTANTGDERAIRAEERVAQYKQRHPEAAAWAAGYGAIAHSVETQDRIFALAETLAMRGLAGDGQPFFAVLSAADRIASAAMWLVVHETYALNVHLDGRDLVAEDFKARPEGHTGGSLNIVPAYVGYLAVNALTGLTRSWVMGQGHTVSAIDSVNLLVGNASPEHAARYSVTDEGLTRYVRDFYSYELDGHGVPASPLGSHVNVHTAGGMMEGGYLGFTELQYVHMPLAGERLVAFLSDGSFEEQRGSDWTPRWWRASDSGYVTPIMINNGRRIDQRTTMAQEGGTPWFERHLELNSFDPVLLDGRDPAAFAWAIFEMEERLVAAAEVVRRGEREYPVLLPYGIASAPKGAGFYGEGTNLAHNLPLPANPRDDAATAELFNTSARRLWVPPPELTGAVRTLTHHDASRRPRERDHPLAHRHVPAPTMPPLEYAPAPADREADAVDWQQASPMSAIDGAFASIVRANPELRARVGNPDEMRSNRMVRTLDELKFRVTDPEPTIPEAVEGAVITALNEEAVAAAALANKGGINMIVTYEAFAPKMFGGLRQEITFTMHRKDAGHENGWLGVPLVMTSHVWENGKNEISHQDPSMAELMLGERSDVARVVFAADWNTATAIIEEAYRGHGTYWGVVAPKLPIPAVFSAEEARALLSQGASRLTWAEHDAPNARLVITAIGAYQLTQVVRASRRLRERGVAHTTVYMLEPGRFRAPRSEGEAAHVAPEPLVAGLYPESVEKRIFVTHTRPEPMLGVLTPLHTGRQTAGMGFIGHGGTLDVNGMLFINRCTWAHIVREAARLLGTPGGAVLTDEEREALDGQRAPAGVIIDPPAPH